MTRLPIIALSVATLLVSACQTTDANSQQTPQVPVPTSASVSSGAQFDINAVLKAGMTKDEVLAVLGQPNTRNDGLNNSLWTYDQLESGGASQSGQPVRQTGNTGNIGSSTGNVASGVGTIIGGNTGRILRGLGQIARSTPRRTTQTTPAPSAPATPSTVLRPKIDVYFDTQGLLTDYQSTLTQ